jgi:hypothetical protein
MGNCSQINNTTIKGTSAVTYDSTPLPCTDVATCDGLNVILSKFNNVICSATASVNILIEEVTNITEDIMIITDQLEDINNQIFICCPICDFTGTADQLPDPTTTTTSSSSTSTSTTTSSSSTTSTTSSTTTVPPTTTTTSSTTIAPIIPTYSLAESQNFTGGSPFGFSDSLRIGTPSGRADSFGINYLGTSSTSWKTLVVTGFNPDYDGDGNTLWTLQITTGGGTPSYPHSLDVTGIANDSGPTFTVVYNDPSGTHRASGQYCRITYYIIDSNNQQGASATLTIGAQ